MLERGLGSRGGGFFYSVVWTWRLEAHQRWRVKHCDRSDTRFSRIKGEWL